MVCRHRAESRSSSVKCKATGGVKWTGAYGVLYWAVLILHEIEADEIQTRDIEVLVGGLSIMGEGRMQRLPKRRPRNIASICRAFQLSISRTSERGGGGHGKKHGIRSVASPRHNKEVEGYLPR
ncbi:hypothetical protein LZ31DRAFT_552748 [Colletotrichum somersetense]|nr:hypothetical protein LZ31DRAFT_552748 [Colletotrichum somersetense]